MSSDYLDRLSELGVSVHADGDNVVIKPGSKAPVELKKAIRENKAEVIALLVEPICRPPQTEQELRRLIDRLADPEYFTAWFDWAMEITDPAEGR